MPKRNGILLLVTTALLAGCNNGPPAVDLEKERAALREAYLGADKAAHQSPPDVEKLLTYYAPDANVYPPGAPMIVGHDALKALFNGMDFAKVRVTALNAHVSSAADVGYTTGTFEVQAPNGQTENGKYITVWKKHSDGSWKIVEDTFNSDTGPVAIQ